jgi:hypothetical protein
MYLFFKGIILGVAPQEHSIENKTLKFFYLKPGTKRFFKFFNKSKTRSKEN